VSDDRKINSEVVWFSPIPTGATKVEELVNLSSSSLH